MANGVELLRLLEPAVRPGGLPGPVRPQSAPIESQSFDDLLAQARLAGDDGGADELSAVQRPANPLADLARVDQVENAALRHLIGRAAEGT